MKIASIIASFFYCVLVTHCFSQTTRPAPPTFGYNLDGVSASNSDPSVHPQLTSTYTSLNLSCVRLWIEGGWNAQNPRPYWRISKLWNNVYLVANFQNSVPRCTAPPDAVWSAYWNAFPTPEITGAKVIQIGNEINTKAYYSGTPEQYAHLLAICYPILKTKGYLVECGSDLNDFEYYKTLAGINAFQYCDRIDCHEYYSNCESLVKQVDLGIAFGASLSPPKPCDCSEFGIRLNSSPTNLTLLGAETGATLTLLKARQSGSVFIPFSFIPLDSVDIATPLDKNYAFNQPVWPFVYWARH